MSRKLFSAFGVLLVVFTSFITMLFAAQPTAVFAQAEPDPPNTQSLGGPYSVEYHVQNRQQYEQAISNCANPSLECLVHFTANYVAIEWLDNIIGPVTPQGNGGSAAPTESEIASGSFIHGISYLVSSMYAHPPAQTGPYLASLLEDANIVPQAYAQGLGFAALNPVLELWKIFRNLAYIFFVLVFIVIGFMIMFRKKIGGQTAVTAQQAIPNIIISLIFVTFSYAIVGFMIDLMYLSMVLVIGIFESQSGFSQDVLDYNIIDLVLVLFKGADLSLTSGIVDSFLSGLADTQADGSALGFIGGITLSLVIAIAILIGAFKLFFELLRAYATVILATVTAPLVLMMGAIPGNNAFGKWFKQVAGNLIPFPTVLLVIVMFFYFTDGGITGDGGFMPPFLLGRGQASTITSLMGLAIILALPEITKHVRENVAGKGGFGEMIAGWGAQAAKQGWTGGQIIPGLGWTDTSKVPIIGSGRNLAGTMATVGAAGAGGVAGGLYGGIYGGLRGAARPLAGAVGGWRRFGGHAANALNVPLMFSQARGEAKEEVDKFKKNLQPQQEEKH